MDEAGRDQGFADASGAGEQVSVRGAVPQFGEQPIRDFAMSAERGQGHRRLRNSCTVRRMSSLTIVTAPRSGTEVVLAWEPSSLPTQVHVAS